MAKQLDTGFAVAYGVGVVPTVGFDVAGAGLVVVRARSRHRALACAKHAPLERFFRVAHTVLVAHVFSGALARFGAAH